MLYELGIVGAASVPRSRLRDRAHSRAGRAHVAAATIPTSPLRISRRRGSAALAGGLTGAALFGGIPLAAIFWLTIGVTALAPSLAPAPKTRPSAEPDRHEVAPCDERRHDALDRPRDRAAQCGRGSAPRAPARPRAVAPRARCARRRGDARSRRGVDGVCRGRARRRAPPASRAPTRVLAASRLGRHPSRCEGSSGERRPDVLHTHTAKAGATGRLAALSAGRARPRARVHTYHGHVLSGYFSRRWEHVFRRIERLLALYVGDAHRRQRGGAGRPRRLRRRAGDALRRRSLRLRPAAVERGRRRSAARDPDGARCGRPHVRRRLGRPPDRDQAPARPHPHAARARRRQRRRGARARRRRRGPSRGGGARRASSGSPTAAASSASREPSGPGMRRSTR